MSGAKPQLPPLFCAIDMTDCDAAVTLAQKLAPHIGGFKLGLEFFCANGPKGVERIASLGQPIFLDLKLHDIPNTVVGALNAIAPLNIALITLHLQGGSAMLARAAETVAQMGATRPQLLGVSVLTSLDDGDLLSMGVSDGVEAQVNRLAAMARETGLDGIVCSPLEIAMARKRLGPDKLVVTPGIRLANDKKGDQKRVMTPREALSAGANILVIGRAITHSDDPVQRAQDIAAQLR